MLNYWLNKVEEESKYPDMTVSGNAPRAFVERVAAMLADSYIDDMPDDPKIYGSTPASKKWPKIYGIKTPQRSKFGQDETEKEIPPKKAEEEEINFLNHKHWVPGESN